MSKITLNKTAFGAVYTPAAEEKHPGAMYARVIELEHNEGSNGTLLATFEQYTFKTPVFSIYQSTDHGLTWSLLSQIRDTKNGWGMRYQPHLYEVPQKTGTLNEGDILCAGNSIPDDMSVTQLQLYKSSDKGATWTYLSTIVTGGLADVDPQNPQTVRPVWEPFLYLDKYGDLVVYYSDERFMHDRQFNQLLAHQVSKDGGLTWDEEVFDVAIPDGKMRPGMPIVNKLPNGKYFMVYEIVGLEIPFIYGRYSDDGLDWGDPADFGFLLECEDGFALGSTPNAVWTSRGGENGTIIVSARISTEKERLEDPGYYLVNSNNGEGKWEKLEMLSRYDSHFHCCGYSSGLITIENDTKLLQLAPVQIQPNLCQIGYAIGEIKE